MADEIKRVNDDVVIEGKTVQINGKTTIDSVVELVGASGAIVLNADELVFANKSSSKKPARTTSTTKTVALTVASSDKLVINRGGGFGGGVTIEGVVSLPGEVAVGTLTAQEVATKVIKGFGKTDKLEVQAKTTFKDEVTLAKGVTCTGPITIESTGSPKRSLTIKANAILVDVPRKSDPLDLVAELIDLRRDFEALKEKVAKLDRK